MAHAIGYDCKLYRNTGTWGSPVWSEIDIVKDATAEAERATVEVKSRASSFVKHGSGPISVKITGQLLHDGGDAGYEAIRDAFLDKTSIDIVALDGSSATSGNQGFRAEWLVSKFARSEPLEGEVVIDFELVPDLASANEPTLYEVA